MRITLVRHAEPQWTKDGVSIDNPPLTDRGFVQAEKLASWVREKEFDEILVSPLVRTRQTAAPILDALNRPLVIEPWLEEIRNPIWHGTPEEKAFEAWRAEKQKNSADRWGGIDGGESVSNFVDRINVGASLFLEERGIVRKDVDLPVWETTDAFQENKEILLVAHAGTNSISICHMLGLAPTPWEWDRLIIGHASVSVVELLTLGDGVTFALSQLSNCEHLPIDLRTF
jgi:probable phosphoglycerate mutase